MSDDSAEHVSATSVTHLINLTDTELVLLDGRCSDAVQTKINAAKTRLDFVGVLPDLDPRIAGFVGDVVTEARTHGRVFWTQRRDIFWCPLHGGSRGYVKFKSGPRKGRDDHKRPLFWQGRDCAYRFVRVQDGVVLGGCDDCVEQAKPHLITALKNVPAQVPKSLAAEGRTNWTWNENRHCTACDWRGHEGEMGRLRTLMGDGTYAGVCPSCGAENRALGNRKIEVVDGFTLTTENAISEAV